MDEINILDSLQRLMRGWRWMALSAILGGLLGWVLSAVFLHPVYEANAEYFVGLNETIFAAEHKMELVTYVDKADPFKAVSRIIYSDDVMTEVANQAAGWGVTWGEGEFSQFFRLDRYYNTWMFSVRHTDPVVAADLANFWVESADRVLQTAYQHAVLSNQLDLGMAAAQKCFSENNLPAGNACAGTSFTSLTDLNSYLAALTVQIAAEQEAGRGLSDALRLEWVSPAIVPDDPSHNEPAILILAGSILGWLVALVLIMRGKRCQA